MAFTAGQKVTADSLNDATYADGSSTNSTAGTTTSTTFTSTLTSSTSVTLNFTAPESGKIIVHIASDLVNSGANFTMLSFAISGSAGTVAAADANALYNKGTNEIRATFSKLITGLTAGQSGTITLQHRVTGGTGTYNNRYVNIEKVA